MCLYFRCEHTGGMWTCTWFQTAAEAQITAADARATAAERAKVPTTASVTVAYPVC